MTADKTSPAPRVSICIPVYNVEGGLADCLDSVIAQTCSDIEVLCVNDCSTDTSPQILDRYAAKDPRIRRIDHAANAGPMEARKTAFSAARGQYILFMDSDDTLPPEAVETLVNAAQSSGADIVAADYTLLRPGQAPAYKSRVANIGTSPESYMRAIMTGTSCTMWGILFRNTIFADPGTITSFPHQVLSEDRMFLVQFLDRARSVATVARSVYNYRLNDGSVTRLRQSPRKLATQFRALDWVTDYYASRPELADLWQQAYTRILSLYLEMGYPRAQILELSHGAPTLLAFGTMRRNVGLRLALHTWACGYIPGYAAAATGARNALRKLLRR